MQASDCSSMQAVQPDSHDHCDDAQHSLTRDVDKENRPDSFDALLHLVGGRGLYSWMILAIMMVSHCYSGSLTLGHTFTAADQAFTCNTNSSVLHSNVTDCDIHAINDECKVSVNCTHASWQEDCSSWIFSEDEFSNTIVSRFDLVCGRSYLAALPSTLYFGGALFGSTMFGMLSDYFGRRVGLLSALSTAISGNLLSALAPTYWMYAAAMFVMGTGLGGMVTVTFAIVSESTVSGYRVYWCLNVANGWSIGSIVVALISFITRDYQQQLLWLCAGAVLYMPLAIFAGESPRWLISTGRLQRAQDAVMRVVRINRAAHKLPANFNAAELVPSSSSSSSSRSYGLADLFRTPGIRRITLLSWVHWFVVSMTFYGISLATGSIGGNIFANAVLVAAVEIPAKFIGTLFTIFGIGRKTVLYISFITSGIFLAIMVATLEFQNLEALRITLAVISKMGITLAFALVWVYYNEVYPTVIRSVGTGSGSTVARIGAMASTLMLPLRTVWPPLPFIIFSIGPFLACAVIYFLPETMGKVLPETIEDGEEFIRNMRGRVGSSVSDKKGEDSEVEAKPV